MKDFLAQYMPPDYSQHGLALDELNAYVHWLMLILFVGWGLLFVFMLMRFRASKHPKASYHGTKSHLSTWIEFAVFAAECVLLFGISIPAWSAWTTRPERGKNPLEIRVVAEQFAWNARYPGPDGVFGKTDVNLISDTNKLGLDVTDPNAKDDIVTLNQLRLELNRPVVIHLTSKDVIHDFNLPYMRVKQDATPGMEVTIHFTPVKVTPGGENWDLNKCVAPQCETWDIACAQLCGIGHYRMKGGYKVHSKEDFAKWMATEPSFAATISQ
jgi:cytochrome c oxidase subunit 2